MDYKPIRSNTMYTQQHFKHIAMLLGILYSDSSLDKPTIEYIQKKLEKDFDHYNPKFNLKLFKTAVRKNTELLNNGRHYDM